MKERVYIILLIISMLVLFVAPVRAEECSINPKEYVFGIPGQFRGHDT